jgi:hypothetical protein
VATQDIEEHKMPAEIRSSGPLESGGSEGVLRNADRTIDIAAYVAIARRERTLAILAFVRAVVHFPGEAWTAISARAVGSERPVSGKDCIQIK